MSFSKKQDGWFFANECCFGGSDPYMGGVSNEEIGWGKYTGKKFPFP